MLLLWVGMVVPATVLVSSVSFALGTLFPRQSTLVKIVHSAGVVHRGHYAPRRRSDTTGSPAWYSTWDPTSAATARSAAHQYQADFNNLLHTAHQRGTISAGPHRA